MRSIAHRAAAAVILAALGLGAASLAGCGAVHPGAGVPLDTASQEIALPSCPKADSGYAGGCDAAGDGGCNPLALIGVAIALAVHRGRRRKHDPRPLAPLVPFPTSRAGRIRSGRA